MRYASETGSDSVRTHQRRDQRWMVWDGEGVSRVEGIDDYHNRDDNYYLVHSNHYNYHNNNRNNNHNNNSHDSWGSGWPSWRANRWVAIITAEMGGGHHIGWTAGWPSYRVNRWVTILTAESVGGHHIGWTGGWPSCGPLTCSWRWPSPWHQPAWKQEKQEKQKYEH